MAEIHVRKDSEVRYLRKQTPYSNWFDGTFYTDTHSHPTPRDPTSSIPQTKKLKKNWAEEKSRGSRHILDIASFSLWDGDAHDYVRLTRENARWVFDKYSVTCVDFLPPFLVVTTRTPSLPEHNGQTSLTLGCAPVVFTSPTTIEREFCSFIPRANSNYLLDRTSGGPLIKTYQATPWTSPSPQNLADIWRILNGVCSVHALNFIWPNLTVELATNNRTYATESLPNKMGGWALNYHQGDPFWKSTIPLAPQRQMAATSLRGDETDYLRTGDGVIGPGIRVEGRTRASSAGVRIRNGARVRITVADHGFEDCTSIYHPDGDGGDPIASIHERFPDHDWALAQLHPSISFSNSRVFECPEPTRLLRGREVSTHEWFVCDGMTTGKIAMKYSGDRFVAGKSSNDVIVYVSALPPASVYFGLAPTSGAPELRDGICGAPIIHEQTGGVAGFFQFVNEAGWCFVPQLDTLIEDGWDLY